MKINKIIQGDTLTELKKLPSDLVDTIITSPPYWGLRDYGVKRQIGLEKTLEEYIEKLLAITKELKRVLKPTGVMFWNMGDCYANQNTILSEYSINDEWLRLLGWIYTDGTILRNGSKICIYQTKERGIEEIKRLLSILNLNYSKYGPDKGNYQFYVHAEDSRKVNKALDFNGEKILPNWLRFCSRRQIIILLEAIISGDGTRRKYDTTIYGLKEKLEPLKDLLLEKDISCKLYQNKRSDWLLSVHQELWNPKNALEKSLVLQNYRLILRMIDQQGWILRNNIIWNKPNHMPSSVKDRFANSYEPVFMLVKNKKYWFDLDAVRIPSSSFQLFNIKERKGKSVGFMASLQETTKIPKDQAESFGSPRARNYRIETNRKHFNKKGSGGNYDYGGIDSPEAKHENPKGKNPGDVWKISTQPFPEAHFATFPEKLVEPMILSSCPKEICKKCGKARVRIIKKESYPTRPGKNIKSDIYDPEAKLIGKGLRTRIMSNRETLGWTDCKCKTGFEAGIILDPFMGSGTVAVVTKQLGRNYLGIELSKEYIKIAEQRIKAQPTPLL